MVVILVIVFVFGLVAIPCSIAILTLRLTRGYLGSIFETLLCVAGIAFLTIQLSVVVTACNEPPAFLPPIALEASQGIDGIDVYNCDGPGGAFVALGILITAAIIAFLIYQLYLAVQFAIDRFANDESADVMQ